MAVIPADKRRAADHAWQIGAWDRQRMVIGRTRREDDGIVQFHQFGDTDIPADRHIADEPNIVA